MECQTKFIGEDNWWYRFGQEFWSIISNRCGNKSIGEIHTKLDGDTIVVLLSPDFHSSFENWIYIYIKIR